MLSCDVAIVGLGPTGALLANLLGQWGWSVTCLEGDEDIYYSPKAVHFDDEAMRIFQAAGLSEAISTCAEPFKDMELRLKAGGPPVVRLEVGNQDHRYGYAGAWWFHQPTLERQLRAGLARFPRVRTHFGAEVRSLKSCEDGQLVTARGRDGREIAVRARWVVGCDGGRSTVRREAGLELLSADFDEGWVVVDTKTRSGTKEPRLPALHCQICDPAQPVTYVPLAGPYYEWQFMVVGGLSEGEATEPTRVRKLLAQFVDPQLVEINRIAYYRFHALWARPWRAGRVILAGDAAHQMPPFLGQGMCSGLRDAHALAWRLDLLLSHRASEDILQDYEDERGQHVREVIRGAMFLGRLIQTRQPLVAWLRNQLLLRPVSRVPALRRWLMATANRKRPITVGFFGKRRRALAGHLMLQPHVVAEDGRRVLLDELTGHGFVLLLRSSASGIDDRMLRALQQQLPLTVLRVAAAAVPRTAGTVGDCDGTLLRLFDQHQVDFVLMRPDRYIYDAGCAAELSALGPELAARIPGARTGRTELAVSA
jgi:3-(3-hydroxy-phenyl)propionate hydroxylase